MHDEACRDVLRPDDPTALRLSVAETAAEGWRVEGLKRCVGRDAPQLRAAFEAGRAARGAARTDLGAVAERAAAIFTIHLAQFQPASGADEEAVAVVRSHTSIWKHIAVRKLHRNCSPLRFKIT